MRANVLVLSVALTGCYDPSIAPCELACASGSACPDGLACNTQNVCAMPGEMCTDPLIDAPPIDTPMESVTIEVRDRTNGPVALALVVFVDAGGTQVAEMPTGADGRASVPMLPGGSATVVRSIPRQDGGNTIQATTYLELWSGAHIINQIEHNQTARQVTVAFTAPAGTSSFGVHVSCSTAMMGTTPPFQVNVPNRCPTFDVLVTAGSPTAPNASRTAFLVGQTASSITVLNTQWMDTRLVQGVLLGIPPGLSNRGYTPGVWITPSLPRTATSPELLLPATNRLTDVSVPTGAGISGQLTLSVQPTGGPISRQHIYDRFLPTVLNLDRDYTGTVIPWLSDPTYSPMTRRMQWTQIVPNGFTASPPSLFVANVQFVKDATTNVVWRVFGPASRIMVGGNQVYVEFPDVPGTRNFEPTTDIAPTSDTLQLWQVEPAAVRPLIENHDPYSADLNFFKVPGLQHLTISQPP